MRSAIPILTAIAVLGLAAAPSPARAVDAQSIADKTFDAVVLRPLGGVATCLGGIMFVPVVGMSAAEGRDGIDEAYNVFIRPFYETTVERELGDF